MNLSAQSHAPAQPGACASLHGRRNAWLFLNKHMLMRIFVLTILLTINGILIAGTSTGQELDKIFISVELKNASMKSALRAIETASKVPFTYRNAEVSVYDNINLKVEKMALSKVLEMLLNNTALRYELVNSNIIIKKVRNYSAAEIPAMSVQPLQLVFDGGIRGKITDSKSQAIPNASVMVEPGIKGAAANQTGEYSITGLKAGTYEISVSAVGFNTFIRSVTIKDNETTVVNVQLMETDNKMQEIVVTALGINRKQRSLGYSTQELKGDNLTIAKEQNVLGSLGGKIAGVQVSGSSAASMGGTQKIQIRGVNSVTGGGEPLIVVDNIIISNTNYASKGGKDYGNLAQDINPDDIETVSVLKGPAASALYGLRGQYGVILITTKKGSKKKPSVNISSAFSVEKPGNWMPLQDIYGSGSSLNFPTININGVSTKYVDGTWDESWGPKMDGTPVRHQYSFYPGDPDFGKATPFIPQPDNIKDYFETGTTLNNGISFTGGGNNTTFRLSYNNTNIKGIEPNTHLKRNNLSFTGTLNITDNLLLSTHLNYANNEAVRPSQGYQALGSRNMYQWFQRNLDMNRLRQYKYADGTYYQWNVNDPNSEGVYEDMTPIDWNNPFFDAYENPSHDSRERFFGDVGITYTILPGLTVNGFIRRDGFTQNLDGRNAVGGRGVPSFWIGKYENKEMNYELIAQYIKEFGKLSVQANLGGNIMTQKYTYLREATVGGLVTPGFYNISNSLERPDVSNILRRKEVRSAFGSVSLGYNNTYFVEASLRRDISSALPLNNNAYLYPSVGASLVFSELMEIPAISFGKLRASYAQSGSDIDIYQTANSFVLGDPYDKDFPMYVPNNLNNPALEPSLATGYEVGLDMRFLRDRVGFNLTYYHQENKKAVFDLDVPGTSGFTSYVINAGNIRNKGIELTVNATPVQSKLFKWTTAFNFAKNESKVTELIPGNNTLTLDQNTYAGVSVFLLANVNEAFGTLIGNGYQRDPETGKILLGTDNMPLWSPNQKLGSAVPDFTGGWTNSFTVGNFDLSAVIDFQKGGKFFSWTQMLAVKSGQHAITAAMNDNGKNIRDPLADGGGYKITGISNATKQEVTAYVNARTYYRNVVGTRIYEEWCYDASYIRMREIRLGYSLGSKLIEKLPVKSINIALIARNPFMIWQKAPKGLNPGELATGSSSLNWLETGQLATVRSFGLNLNISF
ncbi:MAG: SusC/RagA family TonB-linked outer membrane protein [Pseudobacter sp.]|uniref:SusC/RagA family TonB-linked outer membrane protein n=1 Tax=Pseudobacter sp. TaxID=2045420 RepID=UPI003F801300